MLITCVWSIKVGWVFSYHSKCLCAGQCSRKAIGPSDIADNFAKCLMICSKSSDKLSDYLKNFSWILKLKCPMIFSKCLTFAQNHQTYCLVIGKTFREHCRTLIPPLQMHWRYCSLALNQWYIWWYAKIIVSHFIVNWEYVYMCHVKKCWGLQYEDIYILRPKHNGSHFADDILDKFPQKKTFVFWCEFHWSLFLRVQLIKHNIL